MQHVHGRQIQTDEKASSGFQGLGNVGNGVWLGHGSQNSSGKCLVIGTPLCECIKSQQTVHFETVERVVALLFVVCVCICVCMWVLWGWPHRSQRKAMGPLERKVKAVVTYPL